MTGLHSPRPLWLPQALPPGVLVAFSQRGTSPAGEPSPTTYLARRFADSLGLAELPIARATQVHGSAVTAITRSPLPRTVCDAGRCDALVTELAGVGLAVQTADCVPIVLAGERAIAVAHAGWRGTDAGVARAALDAVRSAGEDARAIRIWMGPAIRSCCYEVGPEVAERFPGFVTAEDGGRPRLDLTAANRTQLEEGGVPAENIEAHPACTRCGGPAYASYRRDGAAAGRMIALVARLSDTR